MESDALQPPSGSPAAAASYPPWVLLEYRCGDKDKGEGGDARTAAACRTSAGDPIRVSVRVAAPPAESQVCLQVKRRSHACVVAAHGDSVLIGVGFDEYRRPPDYFVYSAGAGAARPPSLRLLPPRPCYHDEDESGGCFGTQRDLNYDGTGLIMRPCGEDDLVVASLNMVPVSDHDGGGAAASRAAELLLLRRGEWSVKRPTIGGQDGELLLQQLSSWGAHRAVTVGGGGLLCWGLCGRRRGLMFSNVLDEAPVLRRVSFPPAEEEAVDRPVSCRGSTHDVRVVADGTVRLVTVHQ